MSRLIDADALLKELESNKLQPTKDTDGFIDGWCEGFNTVVDMIRSQPTAFDTEKVVEQLEEKTDFLKDCTKYGNKDAEQQEKSYSTMMMYEIADLVEDLIDIVKKGGVE